MNFVDNYEVAGSETLSPSAVDDRPQQSLNEEVSEVLGQLNRFWGGFRKQSQTALEAARKDFGQVVEQAQKELTKLNAPSAAGSQTAETTISSTDSTATNSSSSSSEQPDEDDSPTPSTAETPRASTSTTSSFSPQSLFTRLQSSLPPNIVMTVQSHIPPLDGLRHAASESVDFSQLRSTLTSEFQRVQGVTLAQAEQYVHKSEGILREAVKEAGEFIKDAVKVIPPEEQRDTSVGVLWDGSDVWNIPSYSESPTGNGSRKGKEKESQRNSGEARRAVATRAESLLRRLRHDPDVLQSDPETEDSVASLYSEWLEREVVAEGGISGGSWVEKRTTALNLLEDEDEFQTLQRSLVPSSITEDTFWTRYFFRVYQIDREAERRKALLQVTSDSEDAFSWEDDDEEPTSPKAQLGMSSKSTAISPATHGTATPQESSEDSYDVVSNSGEELAQRNKVEANEQDNADGSENENEEEEGDDEPDEDGEGDSDWE